MVRERGRHALAEQRGAQQAQREHADGAERRERQGRQLRQREEKDLQQHHSDGQMKAPLLHGKRDLRQQRHKSRAKKRQARLMRCFPFHPHCSFQT